MMFRMVIMLPDYIAHIRSNGEIQTCTEHCRNTAGLARIFMDDIKLGSSAYLAGLLHDAGKFTPEFNNYIRDAVNATANTGRVIHSFAGPYCLLNAYHNNSKELGYSEITSEIVSAAIASHHGLMDCIDDCGNNGFEKRRTKQPEYEKKALSEFKRLCADDTEIDELFKQSIIEISAKLKLLQEVKSKFVCKLLSV